MSSTGGSPALRCVLHPGRAAVDDCPVCGRPRCAEDAAGHGPAGCGVCRSTIGRTAPASTTAVLVGAGLASMPTAYLGGPIAAEYVDDHIFSLVVPLVLGVAACWPALVVCHRSGRTGGALVRLSLSAAAFAALAAVLGTAFGFRLYPGGPPQVVSPWSLVGLPYICAAGAALLWPLVYGAPKQREDTD